eukprot:TRINITY_DN72727_c1_g1_i1.p3 TRINITY_DN72727_c1_g1~~TRINITY_DN72727_c1_g1_i1.p3  ORF type:complete len:207 (-),score=16.28 TRINITY_DN72727_c1_g1_i1:101-721(-)
MGRRSSHSAYDPMHNLPIEVKKEDMDKMCDKEDPSEWVKEFAKVYPLQSICSSFPTIKATECSPLANYCKDSKNLQGCSEADKAVLYPAGVPPQVYIDLAKYLETEHKCTGYCGFKCPHYLYSDCHKKDMEADTCDKVIVDLIKSTLDTYQCLIENAATIGSISGVCALAGCFIIMSLFCLCYHKEFNKQKKGKNEEQPLFLHLHS